MFIFLFNLVLGCVLLFFIMLSCSLPCCAVPIFFVCFWGSWFCSLAINQTCISQPKGWFSFILLCRQEKFIGLVHWVYIYKLYQHVTMWGEMCPIFNFCGKYFWPIGKLTWLDKNIFHWIVVTGLKDEFIMYYFLMGPWIVKIVSCFCPMVLSGGHNGEIFIACPHYPFCFKKIRTTTTIAFLISNTVVPNHYDHSSAFDP